MRRLQQQSKADMRAKEIVIFGLGDLARLAALYFEKDSSYTVAAFTANQQFIKEPVWLGKPVVPFERLSELYPPAQFSLFVAIGFKQVNRARASVYENSKKKGYELVSYVNSSVADFGSAGMGDNCFILEKTIIQPYVRVGNNVMIWSGSHIGHDSTIGDHTFIAPCVAISGNVRVGEYRFIGINATIRDGITIAPGCVIGAGAIILKDTVADSVYAGANTERRSLVSEGLQGF